VTSPRTWAALALGWVSLLALLAWWLRTPGPVLREQLKTLQFWSLETCLILLAATGLMVFRDLRLELDRRDASRLAVLAAAALVLTLFVAPRTNRIYFDEQIYQSIGQNLADLKRAQMCNDGTVEYGRLQCWSGEYNKQPYAYPHLLSVLYRVGGVSTSAAFALNAIVAALTPCAVYLLVLTLFTDRTAALLAGLIIVLTPEQILWSATAAVEPSASFACVMALLFAATFAQSRRTASLVATAAATAYAVQFRPESMLIVPVVALLLRRGLSREDLSSVRLWAVGLLALSLLAVHLGHLTAVRNEDWGTRAARVSVDYLTGNLRVNGPFYLWDERFPLFFSVLAIVGLAGRRFIAERVYFSLYFLLFFGTYLSFYAGSYNYGADVRYSLLTFPPIAVLGGLGASRISSWLDSRGFGVRGRRAVAAGLIGQFLWYAPVVRATTEEAWAARADVRFAHTLAPSLRGNAYVLTHNPGMFHVWGISAGQMSLVADNPGQLAFLSTRYRDVYLHWNYWCNVNDPVQQGFCTRALNVNPVTLVHEYRERDERYSLYRYEIRRPPR
jgi:4-amino-4-deoxy-L-arabinose transferase-like glycosyltransferase